MEPLPGVSELRKAARPQEPPSSARLSPGRILGRGRLLENDATGRISRKLFHDQTGASNLFSRRCRNRGGRQCRIDLRLCSASQRSCRRDRADRQESRQSGRRGHGSQPCRALLASHTSMARRLSDCAGSAVTVLTAGAFQTARETRLDLAERNTAIEREIVPEIAGHNPDGILLIATNPVDVLTYAGSDSAAYPPSAGLARARSSTPPAFVTC